MFTDTGRMAVIVSAVVVAACTVTTMPVSAQGDPIATVQVVEYQAGPNWQQGTPPDKQNLGGHFKMVANNYKTGKLLANGPTLDDFHGFYIFNVGDEAAVRGILKDDQGLKSGILTKVKIESWHLFMENLDADTGKKMLFVLNYNPGPAWVRGKSLVQQDIAQHMQHVSKLMREGNLLAGGPVTDVQGRYIIAADNTASAYKFVGDDPAVRANTFIVQVKPWMPFNRQGLK